MVNVVNMNHCGFRHCELSGSTYHILRWVVVDFANSTIHFPHQRALHSSTEVKQWEIRDRILGVWKSFASTLLSEFEERQGLRLRRLKMGLTLRRRKNSQWIRQCGSIVFTRYLKTVRIALRTIFDRYFRGLTTMFTSVQTPKSDIGSSEVY